MTLPSSENRPIPIFGGATQASYRLDGQVVALDEGFIRRLSDCCESITTDKGALVEASRDWWPLAMVWATLGEIPVQAGVIAKPASHNELAEVVAICNEARVPVVAAGGRSGVCGGSIPLYGGVALDLSGITGIRMVDEISMIADVGAGTNGAAMESELRSDWSMTVGHRPQSIAISTVGGWLACRGAGQYSTRYGKIEDIVVGMDVVLADGSTIQTGGHPRQATGPDLNQVFVGSEGTLGLITGARLRLHPAPRHERRAAFGFRSFADGLNACRRILRRGATPAVLRLYDSTEGEGNFSTGDLHPLVILDEGDPVMVDATIAIVQHECQGAEALEESVVDKWLEKRDDVSALAELISSGYVVDTMEVSSSWGTLERVHEDVCRAVEETQGTLLVTTHQSHAYSDGACLYFTFVGQPDPELRDDYYLRVWNAGVRATLEAGGALSHHHGIGLNRARFMPTALGNSMDVLNALKRALDPNGILNPGKLGLVSPFTSNPWPPEVVV